MTEKQEGDGLQFPLVIRYSRTMTANRAENLGYDEI